MTRQELVYCNYDSKHNNLLTLKPKRTLGEENVIPVKLNSIQCWPQTIHDTCTCSWFRPCPHWLKHITLYMMSWIMHTFIAAYYWSIGGKTHRWHHHCFLSNKTNRFFIPVGLFKSWINNISDTISWASCATFCFYHILTWSVIYYMTDTWQHGTYMYLLHKKLH